MSTFNLRLPLDIPWSRRCVSDDMIDRRTGDSEAPYRWRSSLAIFDYEPPEEYQNYPGAIISYLKVVCSITGYQENPTEISLKRRGLLSSWRGSAGITDYLNTLEQYYACFGAVLEVSVVPRTSRAPLRQYPYFMDFEPKKRELYQMASETSERQSRSIESLNVTKSAGTTQSLETYDIDMGGGGFSAEGSYAGTGGGFSYTAPNGQWGTKRLNADETMSSRSTDAGQEKRETFSFTTQLSQLYHQLDSYHLGTNRALFFMLPRPNTLETEHTFINGLRNIEGIQEFFLVVARPSDTEEFCIEAYLETGHIGKVPRTETREIPGSEIHASWSDSYQAKPMGDDNETTVYDQTDRYWRVQDVYPGQGYTIKDAVLSSPGYRLRYNYDKPNLVDVHPHISDRQGHFVKVSGKVHSGFANHAVGADRWEEITYPFTVDITLVKTERVQLSNDTLFMTARSLVCCGNDRLKDAARAADGVVYERKLPNLSVIERPGVRGAQSLHNAVQEGIRRSTVDPEHRLSRPVSLSQTDFAAAAFVHYVPEAQHTSVKSVSELPATVQRRFRQLQSSVAVADLLEMPLTGLQEVLDLDDQQALELRSALMGANHTPRSAREVWLSPTQEERLFGSEGEQSS